MPAPGYPAAATPPAGGVHPAALPQLPAGPTAGGPPLHACACAGAAAATDAPETCPCAAIAAALAALIAACSSSCECASRQSAREHEPCSANLHMRVLGAHVPENRHGRTQSDEPAGPHCALGCHKPKAAVGRTDAARLARRLLAHEAGGHGQRIANVGETQALDVRVRAHALRLLGAGHLLDSHRGDRRGKNSDFRANATPMGMLPRREAKL